MAKLFAYQAFDYRDINLNHLIANQTDFDFANNAYATENGITYEDVAYFQHYSDGGYVGSYFGGTGITFNNDYSQVTGGTVTGYFEEYGNGSKWVDGWLVQNFAYSAVSLAQAANTAGTADDFAAVIAILGGNDIFNLSPYADVARGYGGNDAINGNGGNDLLYGDAGNDTLNGGGGNDAMLGGGGNDTYVVASSGDRVYETTTLGGTTNAGGTDTVRSSVSYTLSSFVEKLVLTGTSAINGTGNSLANTLTGNAAANRLDGGGGNDTLVGGLGNDALLGGAGSDRLTGSSGGDRFVFNSKLGSDTLTDFLSGTDKLALSQAGLKVGDGDTAVEGALLRAAPGGFSTHAELVIFGSNLGALTASAAAAAIGSASSAYAVGRTALFAVDNGASSALYLFTAADGNAVVSATELSLLATLSGTASTAIADYLFLA